MDSSQVVTIVEQFLERFYRNKDISQIQLFVVGDGVLVEINREKRQVIVHYHTPWWDIPQPYPVSPLSIDHNMLNKHHKIFSFVLDVAHDSELAQIVAAVRARLTQDPTEFHAQFFDSPTLVHQGDAP